MTDREHAEAAQNHDIIAEDRAEINEVERAFDAYSETAYSQGMSGDTAAYDAWLEGIKYAMKILPETWYADREPTFRLKKMVEQWHKSNEHLVSIPNKPDQTKYERDTLIWMLIDITGEPNADLFNEAIAEIKKLKEIREGATHWAGNAVHFQQEAGELRTLLGQLVSSDPCRLDHHGYCQEHMWVGKGECAHGRARKLLGYDTQ